MMNERLGPDLERAVEQRQAVGAGELDVAEGDVGLEPTRSAPSAVGMSVAVATS